MPYLSKTKRHNNNNNNTRRVKKASNKSRKMRGGLGCGKYIKEIQDLKNIQENYTAPYIKRLLSQINKVPGTGSLKGSLYKTPQTLDPYSPSYSKDTSLHPYRDKAFMKATTQKRLSELNIVYNDGTKHPDGKNKWRVKSGMKQTNKANLSN